MTPDFRLISSFSHRQTSDHLSEKEPVFLLYLGFHSSVKFGHFAKLVVAFFLLSFLQVMSGELLFVLITFMDQEKEGSSKI